VGDGGIYPRHEFDMGDGGISPINLSFFGSFFSGFENLITLSVIHFKAFRSRIRHFKVLKTHLGFISTLKKTKKIKNFF
jgi:hypothetical protein